MTTEIIPVKMSSGLYAWLRDGRRGVSSNTMAEVFMGLPLGTLSGSRGDHHPRDMGDLSRCIHLLNTCPEYKADLGKLAVLSPEWNAIVAHWDTLSSLYSEELPSRSFPKTWELLEKLLKEARKG